MKAIHQICLYVVLTLPWQGAARAERWARHLPSNDVYRIRYDRLTQDYWFGTANNALWRFDGQHFQRFALANSAITEITALAVDEKQAVVWVGTRLGLFRYATRSEAWELHDWRTNDRNCRLPSTHVTALLVDGSGVLWCGFAGAGIGKLDESGWYRYTTAGCTKWDSTLHCWVGVACREPIPGNQPDKNSIESIAQDEHGKIYFGTRQAGLLILDPMGTWTVIDAFPSPAHKWIQALAIDRQGNKWLGTKGGVCWLDHSNRLVHCFSPTDSTLVDSNVNAVWIESFGDGDFKWFGTGAGISVLDSANCRWRTYTNENSELSSNDVKDITGDNDGNLWFGLFQLGGANQLNNNWSQLNTTDGLSSNFTLAMERDDAGRLWVATETFGPNSHSGVDIFNGCAWTRKELNDGACFQRPLVRDLWPVPDGMWVATEGCGMVKLSNDLAVRCRIRVNEPLGSPFPSNNVSVLFLRHDTLWAGTDEGLVRLTNTSSCAGVRIEPPFVTQLPSRVVTALAFDLNGRLWVGTLRGLTIFDGQNWMPFRLPDLTPEAAINALARGAQGEIWVGTNFGIFRFEYDKEWTRFSTANGLPDDRITAIAIAPDGVVWCGTFNGAATFLFDGWIGHTRDDGLSDNYVLDLAFGPQDLVWFATANGGASHYRISRSNSAPNTFLADPPDVVTQRNVTFFYSGFDRQTPTGQLRYQHALDEASGWSSLTTKTSVTLAVPGEGLHTFRVRAIDKDGNVDDSPATFRFNKLEPRSGGEHVYSDSLRLRTFGRLSLYLPPNAVEAGVALQITPAQLTELDSVPAGFSGIAYDLKPSDLAFAKEKPLTLSIFYGDTITASIDASLLAIYHRNGQSLWRCLGGSHDPARRVLTTAITQLGTFALVVGHPCQRPSSPAQALAEVTAHPRIFSPRGGGFFESIMVSFELGQPAGVTAKVYNLGGRLVRVLCENRPTNPGRNVITWSGRDYNESICPSGLYLITIEAAGGRATKPVMVLNE